MKIHDPAVLFREDRSSAPKTRRFAGRRQLISVELELFARTVGTLLEGGVPILKALEGLEKAASSRELKSMLADVTDGIRRGVAFSEALAKSEKVPSFFHETVYAGEVSGHVPAMLGELASYIGKERATRRGVRDALVYPAFIVAVGIMTLAILTGVVLPKLRVVYERFGTELPLITTVIMGLSKVFPLFLLIGVPVTAYLIMFLRKKSTAASLLYGVPFVGELCRGFARIRFSRLLSLLLESGIPILEALRVVEKTFHDPLIERDVARLRDSLAAGRGFSSCVDKLEWMDPVSRMLILSGEETGRLSESFFQIARDTEQTLEAKIQLAVKLIEPALVLVIGLSVGFVVIAVVLPIFDMSGVIH